MLNPIDPKTKEAAKVILQKMKDVFKKIINSTRIPSLASLVFKPTVKEALEEAPKASENWTRFGLEKTWKYFIPVIVALLIYFGKGALQFLIEIVSQFGVLVALVAIGLYIWKSIK